MSAATFPPRRLWWLAAGFAVWSVALVTLYALHAVGCAFAWPVATLRWALILVLVVHLMAVGWMGRRFARTPRADDAAGRFLRKVILCTIVAALASGLLILAPPLLLSTCV